jgi:hypothetical protein
MRTRTILAASVLFLGGLALCLAADVNMGTWKLNEGKSKFSPGTSKNLTVVYEATGDSMKVTVDGVDKDGKAIHSEWTGKFDGKDYPVTGNPNEEVRSYKRVDDRTLDFAGKKGGKAMASGRVVVAADGKSRTVTTTVTDASGKNVTNVAVYDKQ